MALLNEVLAELLSCGWRAGPPLSDFKRDGCEISTFVQCSIDIDYPTELVGLRMLLCRWVFSRSFAHVDVSADCMSLKTNFTWHSP